MVELLVPPLVGGVIGYFTNYVAIKMLFRPLKPYFFFGKKVPFTPGLIPSKREKLAEAIAKVVKENLITEESIKKRLNEEKVFENLKELIEKFIDDFAKKRETYLSDFIVQIEDKPLFCFDSSFFKERCSEVLDFVVENLNGKSLEEIISPTLRKELELFLDKKSEEIALQIIRFTREKDFENLIYSYVENGVKKFSSHFPFFPQRLAESLTGAISDKIVELLSSLEEPAIQGKISKLIWQKFQEFMKKRIEISKDKAFNVVGFILEKGVDGVRGKTLKELPFLKDLILPQAVDLFSELLISQKEVLSSMAAKSLLEVIERELPVVLESLDIEGMVKEKVNSLPLEEVEAMVLQLIDEELKYITLMGGVLGFCIGLAESFLLLL